MTRNVCPKCKGPISCLGGCSAHSSNWYCDDEKGCGWQAWDASTHGNKSPTVKDPTAVRTDTGTWFQSACSGLWYENEGACGEVMAVKVNGIMFQPVA